MGDNSTVQFSIVNFVDDIRHNLKRSIEYRAWGGGPGGQSVKYLLNDVKT